MADETKAYGPGHLIDWTIGNDVLVVKSKTKHNPAEIFPGRIVKVGRKYATVEYLWKNTFGTRPQEIQVVMETGRQKGDRDFGYNSNWHKSVYRDHGAIEAEAELNEAMRIVQRGMRDIRLHTLSPEQIFALLAAFADIVGYDPSPPKEKS